MIIRAFHFAFNKGGKLLEFDQVRFVNGDGKGINGSEKLFNRDWFGALLSLVAIAGHVADDTTMAASTSEFRFAISECRSFTLASFSAFAFRSPIVRASAFLTLSSASVFVHASPPSSLASRRIQLEIPKFLAFCSGMVSIRVEGTFVPFQVGVVLSVFLACLELGYLEVGVAGETGMVE
jgi:hypothetical protein